MFLFSLLFILFVQLSFRFLLASSLDTFRGAVFLLNAYNQRGLLFFLVLFSALLTVIGFW